MLLPVAAKRKRAAGPSRLTWDRNGEQRAREKPLAVPCRDLERAGGGKDVRTVKSSMLRNVIKFKGLKITHEFPVIPQTKEQQYLTTFISISAMGDSWKWFL